MHKPVSTEPTVMATSISINVKACRRIIGKLQSPGTGPFFGEKTHFARIHPSEKGLSADHS